MVKVKNLLIKNAISHPLVSRWLLNAVIRIKRTSDLLLTPREILIWEQVVLNNTRCNLHPAKAVCSNFHTLILLVHLNDCLCEFMTRLNYLKCSKDWCPKGATAMTQGPSYFSQYHWRSRFSKDLFRLKISDWNLFLPSSLKKFFSWKRLLIIALLESLYSIHLYSLWRVFTLTKTIFRLAKNLGRQD